MTIAAGTLCTDGILLCADSETGDYVGKYQRRKIRDYEGFPLFVTGAGTTSYIEMAADTIYDTFRAAWPENSRDARQKTEEVILDIHSRHISPFYDNSDSNRPAMDLVIAVRCSDADLALIGSSGTATFLSSDSVSVGSGKHLWEYWAQLFDMTTLPASVASYISLFILREVSDNVPGCGGQVYAVTLPRDENAPAPHRHFNVEKVMVGFPKSIVDVLALCVDPRVMDITFEKELEKLVKAIRDLRLASKTKSEIPQLMLNALREIRNAETEAGENSMPPNP